MNRRWYHLLQGELLKEIRMKFRWTDADITCYKENYWKKSGWSFETLKARCLPLQYYHWMLGSLWNITIQWEDHFVFHGNIARDRLLQRFSRFSVLHAKYRLAWTSLISSHRSYRFLSVLKGPVFSSWISLFRTACFVHSFTAVACSKECLGTRSLAFTVVA